MVGQGKLGKKEWGGEVNIPSTHTPPPPPTHTHTHTHTHNLSHTHTHTHTRAHVRARTHVHTRAHAHAHTRTLNFVMGTREVSSLFSILLELEDTFISSLHDISHKTSFHHAVIFILYIERPGKGRRRGLGKADKFKNRGRGLCLSGRPKSYFRHTNYFIRVA